MRLIYMTASSQDEALTIARVLVKERLVACANVLPAATSIYEWEGALREEQEAIMFAKTEEDAVKRVVARVKELHSYKCPCIIAVPITQGNDEFLKWVATSVKVPY